MINANNVSTLYVSQKFGNDKETGFLSYKNEYLNGPVKTIEKAIALVCEMRISGHLQPVSIKILDEEYTIEKPIIIPYTVYNVTIEPNKKTLISGGRKITNFKCDTFNNVKCFSAEIPEVKDGVWYTDLYVDKSRANFTHYPENGTLSPLSVDNNDTFLKTHSKWFIADKKDLEVIRNFKNFNDCFISYNHYWIDEHTPIESYDIETGKIECAYYSRYSVSSLFPQSAMNYIIENVAECFKNPNEWYLDRETAKLYYIPKNEEQTPENIVAYLPVTDKLFILQGTQENSIRNVYIRGFELAYTRGDYKCDFEKEQVQSDKEVFFASDGQSVNHGFGSIEMYHARFCSIEDCKIHSLGLHAMHLYEGCQNIRITGNDMFDLGGGGVYSGGAGANGDEKDYNCNNFISNNIIKNVGKRYFSSCGMLLKNTFGNIVSHNEISDLYYTGISLGWVWGYKSTVSRDNIIEYNHIYDLGKGVLSDMGGIYMLGRQQGTIIRNNIVHDVKSKHYGGWGIYTDEGSSYITVENNICYNLSCNCYHQHYGASNTVRNNIFVKAGETPIKFSKNEMHVGIIFERNIVVADGKSIYKLGCDEDDWGFTQVIASHDNILFDTKRKEIKIVKIGGKEFDFETAQKVFSIEDNSIIADPDFTDPDSFDFSVPDNSPAHKIGFKPINTKYVGVIR